MVALIVLEAAMVRNPHLDKNKASKNSMINEFMSDADEYMLYCYLEEHDPNANNSEIRKICQSIKENYYNNKNN